VKQDALQLLPFNPFNEYATRKFQEKPGGNETGWDTSAYGLYQ
jgi:hypothetical protein